MADLNPDEAIEKLRGLPEDKQRLVLQQLSPQERQGILGRLRAGNAPEQVKPFYQTLGPVGRAESSFLSGFGIPESVQEHPSEAAKGIGLAARHPGLELESLKEIWNSMNESQQKLIDEAYFKQHLPGLSNKAEGFALGVYSSLPVLGPAIVNAVRQYQSGDKAGAAGSFTSILMQFARPGEPKVAEMGRMGEFKPPAEGGLKESVRRTAQGLTGAGPESTTEPLIEKFKKKSADVEAKNRATTEESFRAAGERKATYQEKVRKQQQQYQHDLRDTQEFNRTQDAARTRKTELTKQVDQESADLGVQLATLENQVYKEANRRFEVVRAKVGNPEAPSDDLIKAVRDTEKTTLQGIPENVKEFRRILGLEGETEDIKQLRKDVMSGQGMSGRYEDLEPKMRMLVDDIAQKYGSTVEPNKPLTWDLLQSLKSRIDSRLRNGRSINGDLKRGLFQVREGVVDEMGKMADAAGANEDWSAARGFYRQWREDFHTPSGPSGSGSPVAQALDAVDPNRIRQPFIRTESTVGNRGVQTLRKYAQFGGDRVADAAAKVVGSDRELRELKPKENKPVPAPPKEVPRPKDVEAEYEKAERPTVKDVRDAKERALRQTAVSWGKLHMYDLGILSFSVIGALMGNWFDILADPAFVAVRKSFGKALSRPKVRSWIAQPLPEEIAALNRLPEVMKEDVREKVVDFIKKDRVRDISPEVQRFLGPLAVAATRKKPGQQIKDLQRLTGTNPSMPVGEEP